MRRVLGSALLASVLALGSAACGDDSGEATDPSPTSPTSPPSSTSSTSSPSSAGTETTSPSAESGDANSVDHELIEMVTETAAGGEGGGGADLSDPAVIEKFLAQFSREAMRSRLQQLLDETTVPEGMVAYAAVVAVGCDAPTEVSVTSGADGLVVKAVKVADPKPECLAAMTTVAFLLVPADAV